MSVSCDVVVVGGGPAGALAAAYLAQRGYHVVLLEKQQHPRPNVGESLIPDFWKFCDAAGVSPRLEAEGFIRKAGGTVRWGERLLRMSFSEFGHTRPALHVERDCFDAILLDHARAQGADVRECVAAERVEPAGPDTPAAVAWRDAGGGRGRLACRCVVDASGQRTLIGRQLGLCVPDPAFRFVAVWGYFAGSDYIAADGAVHPASDVRIAPPTTFVSSLPLGDGWGWSWHIQMRASTSVGLLVPVGAFREARKGGAGIEEFFERSCRELPGLGRLLRGATLIPGSLNVLKDYSYSVTRTAGPGYFLIGDAAGFIDPIFSIGVVLAMYGARIAAWAIDRTLRKPDQATRYQAMFAAQLESRIELSRRLALPGRVAENGSSNPAHDVMQWFGPYTQALINTITSLTGRELVDDEHIRSLSSARVHALDDVSFR